MAKILINGYIKENDKKTLINTAGIYLKEDNIIKYRDEINEKTSVVLDLNNNILKRENKSLKYELTFSLNEDTILNCELKDIQRNIIMKIKTEYILKDTNKFVVKYKNLETNDDYEFNVEFNEQI